MNWTSFPLPVGFRLRLALFRSVRIGVVRVSTFAVDRSLFVGCASQALISVSSILGQRFSYLSPPFSPVHPSRHLKSIREPHRVRMGPVGDLPLDSPSSKLDALPESALAESSNSLSEASLSDSTSSSVSAAYSDSSSEALSSSSSPVPVLKKLHPPCWKKS